MNGGKSKLEAMFFPPPGVKFEDADLSQIAFDNAFTKTFKLLGSTLVYDLLDDDAIKCGIKALRCFRCNSEAILQCKRDGKLTIEDCL